MSGEHLEVLAGEIWGHKLALEIKQSSLPADVWAERNMEVIKDTPGSLVGLLELDKQRCYLKYYRTQSWQQRLWFKAGLSRGSRSYAKARVLLSSDIVVPRPYACVLARGGMLLLTEAIPNAVDIQTLWDQGQATGDHSCWGKAGFSLAKLHNKGFFHGDFKWSNLLLADGKIFLVDLEAVGELSPSGKRRYRDIARYTLNAEDMGATLESYQAFLQAYLVATGLEEPEVIKRTQPALNRLRAHHVKKYGERGHPLMGVSP
ncbi:MAG: tRNA A-37 threonylcarbamoyl transferase component Bud32 [Halioglobus sp.]